MLLLMLLGCDTAPWIATTGQIITEKYDCDFGELLEIPDIPSEGIINISLCGGTGSDERCYFQDGGAPAFFEDADGNLYSACEEWYGSSPYIRVRYLVLE